MYLNNQYRCSIRIASNVVRGSNDALDRKAGKVVADARKTLDNLIVAMNDGLRDRGDACRAQRCSVDPGESGDDAHKARVDGEIDRGGMDVIQGLEQARYVRRLVAHGLDQMEDVLLDGLGEDGARTVVRLPDLALGLLARRWKDGRAASGRRGSRR